MAAKQSIYLIEGEESWQVYAQAKKIIHQLLKPDQLELGLEKLSGEATQYQKVFQVLQTPLIWLSVRVVWLDEPEMFDQSDQADQWLAQFNALAPGIILLITYPGKVDGRRKLAKWMLKNSQHYSFPKIQEWETDKLVALVKQDWEGYAYDSQTLMSFVEQVGPHPSLLKSESDKLKTYVGSNQPITLEAVQKIVVQGQSGYILLGESFRKLDQADLFKTTKNLLETDSEITLLGWLVAQIRLWTQILSLKAEGQTFQQIGQILKRHPYFIQKTFGELSSNWHIQALLKAYHQLAHLDFQYKTGRLSGHLPILNWMGSLFLDQTR